MAQKADASARAKKNERKRLVDIHKECRPAKSRPLVLPSLEKPRNLRKFLDRSVFCDAFRDAAVRFARRVRLCETYFVSSLCSAKFVDLLRRFWLLLLRQFFFKKGHVPFRVLLRWSVGRGLDKKVLKERERERGSKSDFFIFKVNFLCQKLTEFF